MGGRVRPPEDDAPGAPRESGISGEHALGIDRELERTREELGRAQAALQLSAQQKADRVSLLVHDLQSPLSVVIGNTDFMLSLPEQSTQNAECLRDVRHAADSMRAMVLDLLDISRSESGALAVKHERVELAGLLAAVQTAMKYRADYRGQRIDVTAPAAALAVLADRELLRRALQNLIDAAIKHGPDGGTILLSARAEPEHVVISVDDQGPALAPEQQRGVFELPQHAERAAYERGPRRWGLGLHFCRIAVDAMAGAIWVDPEAATGVRVCLQLPRAR